MRHLTDAHLPLLFLYGDHDPGLNDLNTVFGKDGRLLTRHPWIGLERVADTDHTFSSETAARQVIGQIVRFVEQLPAARPGATPRP